MLSWRTNPLSIRNGIEYKDGALVRQESTIIISYLIYIFVILGWTPALAWWIVDCHMFYQRRVLISLL